MLTIAQSRQSATFSAPGSRRISAISADASNTTVLSKPFLQLAASLFAPIGDQLIRETPLRRYQPTQTLLNSANTRAVRFHSKNAVLDLHQYRLPWLDPHFFTDGNWNDDAPILIDLADGETRFYDNGCHNASFEEDDIFGNK